MAPIGQTAEVVVWRDRRELTFRVTVGESRADVHRSSRGRRRGREGPFRTGPPPESPRDGVQLRHGTGALDPHTASWPPRMELPESWRGALVLNVDAESPLAERVRPRDVISSIDNQAIQSAEQAVAILNQRADHGQSVTINLDRSVKGRSNGTRSGCRDGSRDRMSPGALERLGRCRPMRPSAPSDRCWKARSPRRLRPRS